MGGKVTKPAPCSHTELLRRLSYDYATGIFTWRHWRPGTMAGSRQNNGYVVIGFGHKLYAAHRLAWLYVTGEWPESDVDHKNRHRADNRFSNLRLAGSAGNQANRRRSTRNQCGHKGVHARDGQYRAQIWDKTHNLHLGYFSTPEAAHAAYCAKASELFGQFACGE